MTNEKKVEYQKYINKAQDTLIDYSQLMADGTLDKYKWILCQPQPKKRVLNKLGRLSYVLDAIYDNDSKCTLSNGNKISMALVTFGNIVDDLCYKASISHMTDFEATQQLQKQIIIYFNHYTFDRFKSDEQLCILDNVPVEMQAKYLFGDEPLLC